MRTWGLCCVVVWERHTIPKLLWGGLVTIRLHHSISYNNSGQLVQVRGMGGSVSLLVTTVNPAKTADLIETAFWAVTQVGQRDHVLDPHRKNWGNIWQAIVIPDDWLHLSRLLYDNRQCGLLPYYFGHLFLLSRQIGCVVKFIGSFNRCTRLVKPLVHRWDQPMYE